MLRLPDSRPWRGLPAFLGAFALLAASACGGDDETTPEPEETTSGDEAPPPASAQRMMDITPDGPGDGEECALQTVYFEFDSDDLDQRSREAIATAVACYRDHGMPARLHLTGAADPRGTEEYNLALGERRAQAVRQYLVSLGVDEARLGISTVGEELARGTDEAGYAQDRNVSVEEDAE